MPPSDPFSLTIDPNGYIERVADVTLRFTRDVGGPDKTWTGHAVMVPVFWTTLFDAAEVTSAGAMASIAATQRRVANRSARWKERTSTSIFDGYRRFAEWVSSQPAGRVELDLAGAAEWRRAPLAAAAVQMIEFFSGASEEPGPMLSGSAGVVWRKRKGVVRLDRSGAEARWPDELPLFVGRRWLLLHPTMGTPPFRDGPFPECRLAEDPRNACPAEIQRAHEQRQAWGLLDTAQVKLDAAERAGNPDFVEPAREALRRTGEAAKAMADTAADFARRFDVFDDGPIWRARVEEVAAAEATLDELERSIGAAMAALGSRSP